MKRGFSDLNQSIFRLTIALANQCGGPGQALLVSKQTRTPAFLDLLATRDDDDVHAWVVRPGQPVHSVRIAIARAALERAVVVALPRPDASDTAVLRRLYTLLVTPVARWLPPSGSALTTVPHGPLFRVSSAALMDARSRYLLERYDIGYGPSATAVAFTDRLAQRARGRSPRGSLIVADPSPLPTASLAGAISSNR
jgi:CHAT domain-containing protein